MKGDVCAAKQMETIYWYAHKWIMSCFTKEEECCGYEVGRKSRKQLNLANGKGKQRLVWGLWRKFSFCDETIKQKLQYAHYKEDCRANISLASSLICL